MDTFFIRNASTRFDIAGDKSIFYTIVEDMQKNGGRMAPSDHWNWNLGKAENNSAIGYTDQLFDERYSHIQLMLNPWIGSSGMLPISADVVERYSHFLRQIDHLNLLPENILIYGSENDWRETDLGSIMDLNLIAAFHSELCLAEKSRVSICEVGGGYGRLAEAFQVAFPGKIHHLLIDAVPGSLMYSCAYLQKQFPELSIGSYYNGDSYSPAYDIFILPSWMTHELIDNQFDICINVESFQEMEQHHVDYYLELFNTSTRDGGLIYISNARDYVFKGVWNMPTNWAPVFLSNTPRSWTADHPTQIFRKNCGGDFSIVRRMLESAVLQQKQLWLAARDKC